MIQDLVDLGIEVECQTVQGGWWEIDTGQDLKNFALYLKKLPFAKKEILTGEEINGHKRTGSHMLRKI